MSSKISRRDFLKGSVAGVGALAATTVLGGCANTNECPEVQQPSCPETTTNWLGSAPQVNEFAETITTETLIVGAGNGGSLAAAYAGKLGMKALVIEKLTKNGDTRGWFGAINSNHTKEAGSIIDIPRLKRELSRYASGKNSKEVMNTWINDSAEMSNFVDEVFAQYEPEAKCDFTHGEEAFWPESSRDGYYFPEMEHYWTGAKSKRNDMLMQYATDRGIEVKYSTELVSLLQDANGKVNGVIAFNNDDEKYIKIEAKNVIIATGGYPGNKEMMEQLDPLGTSVTTMAYYAPQDNGQGIKAAMWAGAKLQEEPAPMLFDRGLVAPGVDAGYDANGHFPCVIAKQFNLCTQPFMKLNRNGVRFTNESAPYNDLPYAAAQQPGHVYCSIMDGNWKDDVQRFHTIGCSASTRKNPAGIEKQINDYAEQGLIFVCDTIEELGQKLGFEGQAYENFLASVTRYNELCEKGEDEDFGKPAVRLSPIVKAPFIGFWMGASLLTTEQGIMINGKGQALDNNSNIIEGLYVIGDASGGMFSNNYPCLMPGIACGRTMTFGMKAVKTIAGLE